MNNNNNNCVGYQGSTIERAERGNSMEGPSRCVADLQEYMEIKKRMIDICQMDSNCTITIHNNSIYTTRVDADNKWHISFLTKN